ncbi:hypothetical protein ACF0H5_002766 [Mactra antiquata]
MKSRSQCVPQHCKCLVSPILGSPLSFCKCEKYTKDDIKHICPVYDTVDWRCRKLCAKCTDGKVYHCAKDDASPIVKDYEDKTEIFTEGCALEKNCSKGEEPILTFIVNQKPVSNPVVHCEKCFNRNRYNSVNSLRSSTYSQCRQEKQNICRTKEHKLECRRWDSSSDRYCRCDARKGYRPNADYGHNIQTGQKCSYESWKCKVDDVCGPRNEDLLLNYTCGPKCTNGTKRSDETDDCIKVSNRVTTSKPKPTIEQSTKVTDKVDETTEATKRSISTRPSIKTSSDDPDHHSPVTVKTDSGQHSGNRNAGSDEQNALLDSHQDGASPSATSNPNDSSQHSGNRNAGSDEQHGSSEPVASTVRYDPAKSEVQLVKSGDSEQRAVPKTTDNDTKEAPTITYITNVKGDHYIIYPDNMQVKIGSSAETDLASISVDTNEESETKSLTDVPQSDSESERDSQHGSVGDAAMFDNETDRLNSMDQCNRTDFSEVKIACNMDGTESHSQGPIFVDVEQNTPQLLLALSAIKDFPTFVTKCKEEAKPDIPQDEYDLSSCTDIKYDNRPKGFKAYETSGYRNGCLYQSVSMLLSGTENYQNRLRFLSVLNAVENFGNYKIQLKKYELEDIRIFFNETLQSIQVIANLMDKDDLIDKGLQQLIMETSQLGNDSSTLHVCLLQAVVNRKIEQHFQINTFDRTISEQIITLDVEFDESKRPFHILWVNSSKKEGAMNHIVPLYCAQPSLCNV